MAELAVTKTDPLTVRGWATKYAVDEDGQRFDREWIEEASADYVARGAIVRINHGSAPVGRVISARYDDDGILVDIEVIDNATRIAVMSGLVRGLGLAIKKYRVDMTDAEAPNGVINNGTVAYLSLLDEPVLYKGEE